MLVAPVRLVLRHLAFGLAPLPRWDGDRRPLTVHELVELAVEHSLRDKEETRTVQVLRGLGYPPLWRQVEILDGSRHLNTVDRP